MKKIIKWLNSQLPKRLCVAMGKGERCVVCWPVAILVLVIFPIALWLSSQVS